MNKDYHLNLTQRDLHRGLKNISCRCALQTVVMPAKHNRDTTTDRTALEHAVVASAHHWYIQVLF